MKRFIIKVANQCGQVLSRGVVLLVVLLSACDDTSMEINSRAVVNYKNGKQEYVVGRDLKVETIDGFHFIVSGFNREVGVFDPDDIVFIAIEPFDPITNSYPIPAPIETVDAITLTQEEISVGETP